MKTKIILPIISSFFLLNSCEQYNLIEDTADPVKAGISTNCIYLDVIPDLTIPTPDYPGYEGEEVPLDIDKDGTNDISFGYYSYSGNQGRSISFDIEPINDEVYIAALNENALVYNLEEPIECDENFVSDRLYLYDRDITYGHASGSGEDEIVEKGLWKNSDRKCIAIRFLVAGEWRLGWIKIGLVEENSKLIIYEYAFSKEGSC